MLSATSALSMAAAAASCSAMPGLKLRPSQEKMPVVGLGLWKVPRSATAQTVLDAIRAGYRHFDCACDYGNEAEVGDGFRAAFDAGLVTREELWVTTKLWNTYHAPQHVEPALRRSLSDLGLEYVDLFLMHFPLAQRFVPFEVRYPPEWIYDPTAPSPAVELAKIPLADTWRAMEALAGPSSLARNIGVCNFNTALLRDLLSHATLPPAVLQIELHPYNQQPQLVRYAQQEGIAVTGFSPLGAGSYVELGMALPADSALEDDAVLAIARKHGVTPAQAILRWGIQRGIALVPKSSTPERLAANLRLFSFELDMADMAAMAKLDRGKRFNDPGVFSQGMGAFLPIYD